MTVFLRYEGPDGRIHNIRDTVAAATKGAATTDPTKVNVGPPTYDNLKTMSRRDLKALLLRVRWLCFNKFVQCDFLSPSLYCVQCLENQIVALNGSDLQFHGKSLTKELNDFKMAVSALIC